MNDYDFFKRFIFPRKPVFLSEEDKKKDELKDAFVLSIECNGCMATDHVIRWIGQVTGFVEMPNYAGSSAEVKIIKKDEPYDIRDKEMGRMFITVADSSLQKLVPGLFGWYR